MTSQLKDESRSRIQKWIRLKLVFVNGLSKKTGYLLEHNDKITVQIPEEPVQTDIPEPIDLDILFEDDQIVVINKPAGLVVHPGISNKSGTLVNGLLFHFNFFPIQAILSKAEPFKVFRNAHNAATHSEHV